MKNFIISHYTCEEKMLSSLIMLKKHHINVYDVFTPYPIHQVEELMDIKRSKLPVVCFVAGILGFSLALGFQTWVFNVSWPIVVGGKPFQSIPAFMPVTFEITVLLGGLITVAAFFIRTKMYPGKNVAPISLKITDDGYVIAIENVDAKYDHNEVKGILKNAGAVHIEERELLL